MTSNHDMDCDPLLDERWTSLADREGDLFASTRWLRVLSAGYGLRFRGALFGGTGDVRGGVVWSEINDVRGHRRVSLPFSDFTDPIGSVKPEELSDLASSLIDDGSPLTLRLRAQQELEEERLVERGRLAWHRKSLGDSDDALWDSLRSGARQNIRKAKRNELVVTVRGSREALSEFRQLHVELRKAKYRMLAQPSKFFSAIADEFGPDDARVVMATKDGRPIAGVVLLRHGDTAYYKFNASTSEALETRANDLVMWTAMLEARAWGSDYFDFGVSDLDQPGLIRYKRKYADEEGSVVVLRSAGPEPSRRASLMGKALPAATRILTDPRCPDRVTARGGDVLYRRFC